MKKFTKIAVVLAVIFAVVGIICVVSAFAMGFTWGNLKDMVNADKFNFAFELDDFHEGEKGIIGGQDEKKGNVITPNESFRNLDIEFGAGALEIVYTDVESVEVQNKNVQGFKCYVEENTLHIKGGLKVGVNSSAGSIVVNIPRNMIFDEFDLELDAGNANISGLVANSVDIGVGAGDVELKGLDTKALDAEVGAGDLYIELVGGESDYNYEAECGIGDIKIGATSVSGMGGSKKTNNPGASRFLDLECGIGEIQCSTTSFAFLLSDDITITAS